MARNLGSKTRSKVLSHDVASKRERETGLTEPPLTQVLDQVKSLVREGQLPFVDEQSDLGLALNDGVLDLVEGRYHGFEVWLDHPQGEIGAREQTGNGDTFAANFVTAHRAA